MADSPFIIFSNIFRNEKAREANTLSSGNTTWKLKDIRDLAAWAETAPVVKDFKGDDAVEVQIWLNPKESKSGKQYWLQSIKPATPPEERRSSADPETDLF